MPRFASRLAALALPFAAIAFTAPAMAGPEVCGNIELTSITSCSIEFDGGCQAQCEPLRFIAACDGQCNVEIDASCESSCQAACDAECSVDPGSFDCRASCNADCSAEAAAYCDTGDSECTSYFQAQCSSECEASCDAVPPSADCQASCQACCGATCDVSANASCSLDCTAEMQGGCEVQCSQPEGALFCDGQYIAATDIPACIEYMIENLDLSFEAEASAQAILSCAIDEPGIPGGGANPAWLLGLGLGIAIHRRRRG